MKYRGSKMRKFNLLMSALTLTSLMPVFGADADNVWGDRMSDDADVVVEIVGDAAESASSASQEIEDRFQHAYNLLNGFMGEFRELTILRDSNLTPDQRAKLTTDALSWSENSVDVANDVLRKLDTYLPFHQRFLELRICDIELANKQIPLGQSVEANQRYMVAFEGRVNLILEIIREDFITREAKMIFGALMQAYLEVQKLAWEVNPSQEERDANRSESAEAWRQFNVFKNRANLTEDERYDLSLIKCIDPAFMR
jgi:hypothetical protein